MTPEFSRPVRIDTLGEGDRAIAIEADEAERAALATRFGLISIERLAASATLTRKGDVISAQGRIEARVTQACVATGQPLPASVAEPFTLKFVPEAVEGEPLAEIELDVEDCDTIDYAGGAVDLGEAVAETLVLALDPFPRAPDADKALKDAGVVSEDEAEVGPFAALKALKDKLG
jgi:uncharacterized metal-binding protein YceD (DUF177 family)